MVELDRKHTLLDLEARKITIDDLIFVGTKIPFKGAPLLIIQKNKAGLACGYFSIETANKTGAPIATVSGVEDFEDMMEAEVNGVSEKAKEMGIKEGMTGEEALKILGE
ncbi:MAG: YunC family protein [Thermoplasmata archaeon]